MAKTKESSKKKSNAGRKSVWETTIEPNLDKIKKWYNDGVLEKDIIENLGIAPSSYYKYKAEKTELSDIEKESRAVQVEQIKAALFKRAIGYEYEESKTYYRKPKGSQDPNDIEYIYTEKYKKHKEGDTTAQLILLKHWDKDGGWTGDPRTMALKEKQFAVDTVKTMNEKFINPEDFSEFEKVLEFLEGDK